LPVKNQKSINVTKNTENNQIASSYKISKNVNIQKIRKFTGKKSILTINDIDIFINNKELLRFENIRKSAIEKD